MGWASTTDCPVTQGCDRRGVMKKTICLIAVLLFLATAREARCQEKIRVGQGSISLQSGLMHIGNDRGLFAKYGLVTEVIYIPGGSINVQVLVSGNLDLSQLSGCLLYTSPSPRDS